MNKKKPKPKPKAKRKKKRKRSKSSDSPDLQSRVPLPPESRLSMASTVAWLLCCLATLIALIGAVVTLIVHRSQPSDTTAVLNSVFLFISLITGFLTLLLTYVCQRVRDFPPPRGITIGTTVIGSSALVLWLADQLLSR